MAYKVIRSEEVNRDLRLILRHLVDSYVALGDPLTDAFERAAHRVDAMLDDMRALGHMPHQGTQLPAVMPGLRQVTKKRAIFYFTVEEDARTVRIIAVFFSGQDHGRHIQARLTGL
ncbi:plasmid stabilization system protein ParE [Neorhizobium sp. 2083]|uniref:type II toxin-antitoxin system RelE/ParE family toxin n=1 Tax=Neorhizobium sp. 2083 TaxID=2817762 RepID=UPI002861E87E|nr:type II toxin-antitoxin system RelE/ParE family toxin [Neorhizobium sp. 2083]MDR6817723.1 plasmid stabilization system protein ParE [Neorhizobium sp. 2083]